MENPSFVELCMTSDGLKLAGFRRPGCTSGIDTSACMGNVESGDVSCDHFGFGTDLPCFLLFSKREPLAGGFPWSQSGQFVKT